jgi:hypothetical protein
MGYKSFLMEIGLYGNPLGYNHTRFSALAMDGAWIKNVWELLNDFHVTAEFGGEYQLSPVRAGDCSLLELFLHHYQGEDLALLSIFRQHKKVIHISCIVLSNGRTVDKECLTKEAGRLD